VAWSSPTSYYTEYVVVWCVFGLSDTRPAKEVLHRRRIAEELLTTEFSYGDGLGHLISTFRASCEEVVGGTLTWDGKTATQHSLALPPRHRTPLSLTKELLQDIFCNVESILLLHSLVLSQLEKRINHEWGHSSSRIGDVFTSLAEQFKVYIQYVNNYDHAVTLLRELRSKDPKLDSFLRHKTLSLTGSFACLPLESFLILPVQRLPRYEMLLKDLLKNTWPEHPDYTQLERGSKLVKTMANSINESKRESELMDQALLIQRKFVGLKEDLLLPHRRFIMQGILQEAERGVPVMPRRVFLFSDILVISDEKTRLVTGTEYYDHVHTYVLAHCEAITLGKSVLIQSDLPNTVTQANTLSMWEILMARRQPPSRLRHLLTRQRGSLPSKS
jgi:hypothetical protein